LRGGDLAACFGPVFANSPVRRPLTIPGGRMRLVHRIESLEPQGGRFGLGRIRGEADIHPDDWFLTCHFSDDQVMPGTLMYECCFHTLRVFLLRMGWVPDADKVSCGPIPGIASKLKCRGQVTPATRTVTYEVVIKEIGYNPNAYVIADALMYADGKPVVDISNLCLQYEGYTETDVAVSREGGRLDRHSIAVGPPALPFDYEQLRQFTEGDPSACFGPAYAIFDEGAARTCARLPRPPFLLMSRVVEAAPEPLVLKAGGPVVAEYDVPADAWYFDANRQDRMPYSILLEIVLQPCGFFAAYAGSVLTSDVDLRFRNLGGAAVLHAPIDRSGGALRTRVMMTNVARSAGMIIEDFVFELRQDGRLVYSGSTNFGFFTETALRAQVGIRDAAVYQPSDDERARAQAFDYPQEAPFPDDTMRMLDRITCYVADGGPNALGYIEGETDVNSNAWFFQAHFYQDPVWPGSLGLESFLQLLKLAAVRRWGAHTDAKFDTIVQDREHRWTYRGQILPTNRKVTVQAWVTEVDDAQRLIMGAGYLSVDGTPIYQIDGLGLRMA
jgi:3-hydroxymyristoyl/3-hydroxydecanoyl-(acyl carrier protein) dehydratase